MIRPTTHWLSCFSDLIALEQHSSPFLITGGFALCIKANMNSKVERTMPSMNTTWEKRGNKQSKMRTCVTSAILHTYKPKVHYHSAIGYTKISLTKRPGTMGWISFGRFCNTKNSQIKLTRNIIHTMAKLTRFILCLPSTKFSHKNPTPAKTL